MDRKEGRMSYIEKEKLIKADIASIENLQGAFDCGYRAGMSVKSNAMLEQIKDEIEEKGFNSPLMNPVFTMTEILEIIDRYINGGDQ